MKRYLVNSEGKFLFKVVLGENKILYRDYSPYASWTNIESDPDIDVDHPLTPYLEEIKMVGLDNDGTEIAEFATYDSPTVTGNTDGTDGQVMVKFPPLWVERYYDENGYLTGYSLANWPKSGFTLHPCFWDYDSVTPGTLGRDAIYVGAYEATNASGNILASVSGVVPLTNLTMAVFRQRANARSSKISPHNNEWHLMDFWTNDLIMLLFYAYYGTRQSQEALPGFTERTAWNAAHMRTTGRSNILTTMNGSVDADLAGLDSALSTGWLNQGRGTAIANRFLFIENIFGHIWKFVDGCSADGRIGAKKTMWHTPDPRLFSSDQATILSTYEDLNVDLLSVNTESYIGAVGDGFVPLAALTADSEKFWCDNFWSYLTDTANRNYLRSVHAGGNLNNGAKAGLAARNANNDLANANANNGARLSYDVITEQTKPCLLAKHKNGQKGIGSAARSAKVPCSIAETVKA